GLFRAGRRTRFRQGWTDRTRRQFSAQYAWRSFERGACVGPQSCT
ncbi:MAG: lipid-transfer protein, partial [Parvibaculum sp.]